MAPVTALTRAKSGRAANRIALPLTPAARRQNGKKRCCMARCIRSLGRGVLALAGAAALAAVAGCGAPARYPVSAGTGPRPAFPPPDRSLIPLVNVVTAKGWPEGSTPKAADGTA